MSTQPVPPLIDETLDATLPDIATRILTLAPVLLYVYDLQENRNIYANRELTDLLGYSVKQVQAMGAALFATILHPDDLPLVIDAQVRLMAAQDDEVIEVEYRMRHADASWRWLQSREVVFKRDTSGAPTQKLGTAHEVTKRKQSDAEIGLFKAMVENAQDGIAIAGPDAVITYANPAFAVMSGLGDQAVGTPFAQMYGPDGLAIVEHVSTPAMHAQGRWQGNIPAQRPDGSHWVAQMSAFVVNNPVSGVPQSVAIFRDSSAETTALIERERQAATMARQAAELRLNEERQRLILANLPVVLAIIDQDGIFQLSTGLGLADLGLTPGQVVGANAYEMYQQFPQIISEIKRGLAGETFATHSDLGGIIFESRYLPLRDIEEHVTGVMVLSLNVTDRHQAEAARNRMQEDLIMAQQAALRELSTPLIPVAKDVVVMPLIGSIDSARAHQVIDTLLQGVAGQGARTAIIDITGVPVVDTQVANALIRAAQAVKLLGARVVLTGIRPEVAQTLVGLGADLSGITTRGTLQAGITETIK